MNEFDHSHLHNVDGEVLPMGMGRRQRFDIHKAAVRGDLDRVRQLIDAGVPVDILNEQGRTPLHLAAYCGEYEVAALLINSNCDLDLKDSFGNTPMMLLTPMLATRPKPYAMEILKLLIRRGAQVNCVSPDPSRDTLLHVASFAGWTEIVRLILDNGEADLNAVDHLGRTPLMRATIGSREEIAALLIRAGADVNISDDVLKSTALHFAAMYCHSRVIEILLEKEGLDLNPQDIKGHTPLHTACHAGIRMPPDIVKPAIKQLLDAGVDINMKSNQGETALSEGIRCGYLGLEEIRLFVQKGAFLENYVCESHFYPRESFNLKESILKDVEFCTQSIVNKFHHSLPILNSITYFARRLPNVGNFKLRARHIDEVKNLVKCEIERNTFCDVVKVHPITLSALCVQSLITCQSGKKRASSPDFGHSPFKKIHN